MVKTDVVERRILPAQGWRSSSAVGKDMRYAELMLLALLCEGNKIEFPQEGRKEILKVFRGKGEASALE